MTELRPITEENFLDAFHLRLAQGLEGYQAYREKVRYKVIPLIW